MDRPRGARGDPRGRRQGSRGPDGHPRGRSRAPATSAPAWVGCSPPGRRGEVSDVDRERRVSGREVRRAHGRPRAGALRRRATSSLRALWLGSSRPGRGPAPLSHRRRRCERHARPPRARESARRPRHPVRTRLPPQCGGRHPHPRLPGSGGPRSGSAPRCSRSASGSPGSWRTARGEGNRCRSTSRSEPRPPPSVVSRRPRPRRARRESPRRRPRAPPARPSRTGGTAVAGERGPVSLDDKYGATSGRALMSGIQALVRLTARPAPPGPRSRTGHRGVRQRLPGLAARRPRPGAWRAGPDLEPGPSSSRRASTRSSPPPPSPARSCSASSTGAATTA